MNVRLQFTNLSGEHFALEERNVSTNEEQKEEEKNEEKEKQISKQSRYFLDKF